MAHAPRMVVTVHGAAPHAALDLLLAKSAARGAPRSVVLRGGGGGAAAHGAAAASVPAACLARLAGVAHVRLMDVALTLPDYSADGSTATAAAATPAGLLAPLAAGAGAMLRALDLGAGWAGGAALQDAAAALAALATTAPRLEELRVALPAAAVSAPPAALAGLVESAGHVGAQLREAAAGLLAALAPLRRLRVLKLTGLPDVWAPKHAVATDGDEDDAAGELLPRSFEALGARMAGVMPRLCRVDVALAGGWAMHWRAAAAAHPAVDEDDEAADDYAAYEAAAAEGAAVGPLTLRAVDAVMHLAPGGAAAAAAAAAVAPATLLAKMHNAVAPYCDNASSAAAALAAVASLQLTVPVSDVPALAAALSACPALRALRLTALATSAAGAAPLGAMVAAVAAAAPRLRSLVLVPGLAPAALDADTLAPLAAHNGPLRTLKIVGALSAARGAAPEAVWAPVAALAGLQRLAVHHVGGERVALAAACLPAALEVLDLKGVRLAAAAAGAPTAAAPAGLCTVNLVGCEVDDVAALAAGNVTAAVVAGTRLGNGGWHGAARSWPALASLRASFEGAAVGAAADLLAALPGFERLEALALQRLPALDDASLAALLAAPGLRRLSVGAGACAVTAAGVEAAGAVVAAATAAATAAVPAKLRSVALQLPARHLPAHLQQLLAGGAEAAAAAGAGDAAAAAPWWVLPAAECRLPGGRLHAALAGAFAGAAIAVQLNQAPRAAARTPCEAC
jgi:hypothetical protein